MDPGGLRQVKVKIGESLGAAPDRDLDRMAQVRSIVGDVVAVFVDANAG
jgi:L-alanine-DL-glutamate epimerase-like enolase superfamily enzyme